MAVDLRGPDFFIVGAPKCGTTAMTDYLGQHPEIGMAARKESHYFGNDIHPRMARRRDLRRDQTPEGGREDYLQMFAHVQDRKRLGEASVWYLYSTTAAREIKQFASEADIIAMIRNPVEMLPSLHSTLVEVGLEPEPDLERALALDEERMRFGTPRGFPPHSYRSAVRYAEQLCRYVEVFGREKVHVIVYDDFRDDTAGVYRRTCEFLGVDRTFVPKIRVLNTNRRVRSRLLRDLVWEPPERLRPVLHAIVPQRARTKVGTALKQWNTEFVPRRPPPDHFSEPLRPLVQDEVRQLNDRLGIDVSRWVD